MILINTSRELNFFDQLGEVMKISICKICSSSFVKDSVSKVCSLKCRIIEGSEKQKNGCWIWVKNKTDFYGKVRWKTKTLSAHRASYSAFKSEVPKGLNVCHTCDNPLCVNPDHLWAASQKENILDAKSKKRLSSQPMKKFADQQISDIKKRLSQGTSITDLANQYKSSYMIIWLIKKEKHYRGVT